MQKTLIISISFLLGFCSIGIAVNVKEDTDNAASYYEAAISLMVYPESDDLVHELWEVIDSGWQKNHKELKRLLNKNKACFKKLKKALLLEKCDFHSGKEEEDYVLRDFDVPKEGMYRLSQLLSVRGRYYEKRGNVSKAIDDYLSVFTLAYHLSQDDSLIVKLLVMDIELRRACTPLKDYVNSPEAEKSLCQRILRSIENYESKRFLLKVTVESNEEFFISFIEETKENSREEPGLTEDGRKKLIDFTDKTVKAAHQMADRYFGNYIKAAESGKEENRKFASSEREKLMAKADSYNISTAEDMVDFIINYANSEKELDSQFMEKYLTLMLNLCFSDHDKIFDKYYRVQDELKEIKSIAKSKIEAL